MLPVLTHTSRERPYITAGVYVSSDREYGPNLSYHRTARIGKTGRLQGYANATSTNTSNAQTERCQ